jgi:hypothetical protein
MAFTLNLQRAVSKWGRLMAFSRHIAIFHRFLFGQRKSLYERLMDHLNG